MKLNTPLSSILTCLLFCSIHLLHGQITNDNSSIFGVLIEQETQSLESENTIRTDCDTTFSITARDNPSALAWDGENFWFASNLYIYEVTPSGVYLDSFANPAQFNILRGGGLTFDGTSLWYQNEQTAELFKIDPANGTVQGQFDLNYLWPDTDPNGGGLAWDGEYIWLTSYDPPRIFKIDPANGAVMDSLITTQGVISLEWKDDELLGIGDDYLYKINSTDGKLEDSVDWCVPFPLGLTWDGNALWNMSGPDELFGISTGGKETIYMTDTDIISSLEGITGINEIKLFPNPAFQNIRLEGSNIKSAEIYDLMGRMMYTERINTNRVNIDISFLSKGAYLLVADDGNKKYTHKLIVQ